MTPATQVVDQVLSSGPRVRISPAKRRCEDRPYVFAPTMNTPALFVPFDQGLKTLNHLPWHGLREVGKSLNNGLFTLYLTRNLERLIELLDGPNILELS
jgi:hypothetical protein